MLWSRGFTDEHQRRLDVAFSALALLRGCSDVASLDHSQTQQMALSSAQTNAAAFAGAAPSPATAAGTKPVVKEERPDEAEIRELAAKMVEANKAKTVLAQQAVQQQRVQQISGQANILAYLNPKPRPDPNKKPNGGAAVAPTKANANSSDGLPAVDDESQRGRFGWSTFGDCHIPYILRSTEKYCAVRILESKLLNKYLSCLHPDIYNSTCIRSYYITEAEGKLLNEINIKHCENQFGRDQFTVHDLIVRLSDVREFYMFLDICYTKLTPGATPSIPAHNAEKCGFIRINKESVVPYTVKNGLKYVPLFYFEGETENLKLKAEKLEGWDLAYLKFCCKAQGIRNELFASETCSVISLADIKSYFPQGTNFEDYWPNKVIELVITNNKSGSSGGWTKQPPKPPVNRQAPSVNQNNVAANAINARAVQQHRANTINSTIQRAQAAQRTVQQASHHPAHSANAIVNAGRIDGNVSRTMINAVQAINGWSGLVGGQPSFSALVSQANQINRIPNSTLNIHNQLPTTTKSYTSVANRSRGGGGGTAAAYPVYPVSTMQNSTVHVQPPPLVRATAHSNQPNLGYSTYGKDDWVSTYTSPSLGVQNVVNASTYPQMLGLSAEQVQALMPQQSSATLLPHSQRHTPPQHTAAAPHAAKYPPPLIPVNNSTSANSSNSNNDTTNSRQTRGKKGLIPIGDTLASSHVQPYQIQRALVEEKFVSCINFKPYVYNELLMTLPDFVSNYFPNCSVSNCREVLSDVLCIELYQGNRLQMEILHKNGKCQSVNEELPLIQVQSIMKYRRQLKYILENNRNMAMTQMHSEEHQAKKRQRIS